MFNWLRLFLLLLLDIARGDDGGENVSKVSDGLSLFGFDLFLCLGFRAETGLGEEVLGTLLPSPNLHCSYKK